MKPLRLRLVAAAAAVVIATATATAAPADDGPRADHHQHLFGPAIVARATTPMEAVDADRLIALLDQAGIRQAAVLSLAYMYGNPNRPPVDREHEAVKAENDWTSAQVAGHPERLVALCSVNPLRPYALEEIARCATDPRLKTGLKLHFGNSDVNLTAAADAARLRQVFALANRHRMALVQIAHHAGSSGYDEAGVDAAVGVFVDAIAARDPRVARLSFDVSGIAGLGDWPRPAARVAERIRQLGTGRIVWGADGAAGGTTPGMAWTTFKQVP